MQRSKIPLRKWAIAIYLCLTNLKSVSSMKLHRDIGVTQATAWFMLHRIRQAWAVDDDDQFDGPRGGRVLFRRQVENMSLSKRKKLAEAGAGRGAVGKTAVVGIKDRDSNEVRAEVVTDTTGETLQGFVREHAEEGATVYTDEHRSYRGLAADFNERSITRSANMWTAITNGWSRLLGRTRAPSTRSARSIFAMLSSRASITFGTQDHRPDDGESTETLLPRTGFRTRPGRSGSVRRKIASVSGVAPGKSPSDRVSA